MKKSIVLLPSLAALLLLNACRDIKEEPAPTGPDPVVFDALAVGKVFKYLGFEGKNYNYGDGSEFTYSNDTLVLKVVSKDAAWFKIEESLHYVDSVGWYGQEKDATYYYFLYMKDEKLHIEIPASQRSRIFRSNNAWTLPLSAIEGPTVAIKGWKTDLPYCECYKEGFTENYTLFGQLYPRLNVVMDDTFMQVDGPGRTYLYSPHEGIVKFSEYSWWTQSGYGWDLIPE